MSPDAIEIRAGTPADDDARDRYVRAHARGSFFHLSGWRRVVERVMRHRGQDLLAFRDGRLVGVLPLVRCRSLLGPPALISMPYAVYGGPLGDARPIEEVLFRAAERTAVEGRVGRLELRCRTDPGLDLPGSDLYATFERELPEDPAQVLAQMPKKARAEARKARERHGLELVESERSLDVLVDLFHRNKRQLGSPALPRAWFDGLRREFGADCVVHVVQRGAEPLAAVLSFLHGDTLLAYHSGTAEGADRSASASNFMYMSLQEWAVGRGLRRFDFGRSRRDAGAFQFKVHQGFDPEPLHYRYRLVRDRHLPSLNPSNPRTRRVREIWSRLPLWVTRALSTRAARYLP